MSLIDELGIDLDNERPDELEDQLSAPMVPPPGKYHAVLKGAKATDFKSGSSGYEFEFEILCPSQLAGKVVTDRLIISEKTKSRQRMYASRLDIIRAVGEGKDKHYEKGDNEDFVDAIGTEVVIEVENEEYTKEKGGKGVAARVTYAGVWPVDDERVKDVPKAEASAATVASEKAKSEVVKGDDLNDI